MAMLQLERLMMCPGCTNAFTTSDRVPMQLYCGHTICSRCLPSLPKDSENHILCPYDRQPDIRDLEDISESHHLIDTIEKTELCCVHNFNDAAEWYCPETLEAVCERCRNTRQQWLPIRGVDVGQLYAAQILGMLGNPQVRARALETHPNLDRRLSQLPTLTPRARESLYFSLLGRPIPTLPKPRGVTPTTDENGWVVISRFHNIIPEKYCSNFEQIRRWAVSQNPAQVEALCVRPSATVRLRALLLCKECGSFRNGCIQSIHLTEGSETTNSSTVPLTQSPTPYSHHNKQTQKVTLARPVELRAGRDYTFKVKYTGQHLYFGDPSRRIDNVTGADGVTFKVSDPKFTGGDIQNGQGALAGPIVGWFYQR